MFNSGDTVEEKATGRRGTILLHGRVGQRPTRWTVQFSDGRQPLIQDFTDPNDLRVVGRHTEEGSPRLVPETPVV